MSHVHEGDDLLKGLSPFTCGVHIGEHHQEIATHATHFDQIMLGHTNPMVAEQETLHTREIPLPVTLYQFAPQLMCTSIIVNVAMGKNTPLVVALPSFCLVDWPHMETTLQGQSEDLAPVVPSMLAVGSEVNECLPAVTPVGTPVASPSDAGPCTDC